jgi:N-dimethylarginine dimethylaminohydrolase
VSAALAEHALLVRCVLKHVRDAWPSQAAIDAGWRELGYTDRPVLERAIEEYEQLVEALSTGGTELLFLPPAPGVGLDSLYVRDAALVCERGAILAAMGKPQRAGEPAAQREALAEWRVAIAGAIRSPGSLEGGDLVWLDERTAVVGRGYRTNDAGIRQLRELLGDSIDELLAVHLPHWRGPADVFHLMSVLSPVDRDLAVVYAPLLPVPLHEALVARGIALVEVPHEEFTTLGANVLALAPRRCLMLDGNPRTRARLERAGAEVRVYRGTEISLKGGGGPTCLTRPILRRDRSSARDSR